MVERGQVLERMAIVPASTLGDDVTLEALVQSGGLGGQGQPVVLVPPHPRLGGSMDSAALAELVWGLGLRGHPTLRFNHRGVGASGGALAPLPWIVPGGETPALDLEPLCADVEAVLDHHGVGLGSDAPVALVGLSLGALVAARVALAHPRVDRLVLIAPPASLSLLGPPVTGVELAATGMPILVVCGGADRVAPADVVDARFGAAARAVIIEGADHSFTRGLSGLSRAVVEFLAGPL